MKLCIHFSDNAVCVFCYLLVFYNSLTPWKGSFTFKNQNNFENSFDRFDLVIFSGRARAFIDSRAYIMIIW